jgi:hypothetical protein
LGSSPQYKLTINHKGTIKEMEKVEPEDKIQPKMSVMEIQTLNARIVSTYLGAAHGTDFGCSLLLNYGTKDQNVICPHLYEYDEESTMISWKGAIPILTLILNIAGVNKWEDLSGRFIRVRATHDKVHAIGHIIEDKWLDFDAFVSGYKQDTIAYKQELGRKQIIVIENQDGFEVYVDIDAGVDYLSQRGIAEFKKREPALFTPDLYTAVKFVNEYNLMNIGRRIIFVLGEMAGVEKKL